MNPTQEGQTAESRCQCRHVLFLIVVVVDEKTGVVDQAAGTSFRELSDFLEQYDAPPRRHKVRAWLCINGRSETGSFGEEAPAASCVASVVTTRRGHARTW
jgi:hypothetical protein